MIPPAMRQAFAAERVRDMMVSADQTRNRPGRAAGGRAGVGSGPMRFVRRLVDSLGRGWRDSLYLHRQLLEAQRPWDHHGPLRWQRQRGGWRIAGSQLPDNVDGAPESLPNDLAPK